MDDRDLQLLRQFRADEAEPPAGLQARIEERLWQAIIDEEATKAGRGRRASRPGFFQRMLRPLVAAGAAGALALGVAIASDGGAGQASLGQSAVTQAGSGVLDATASALFGGSAASAATPIAGRIDLTDGDERLVAGPQHDDSGERLNEDYDEVVVALPRDPAELRDAIRMSIADAGYADPGDALAFQVAMRWVTDPAVPVDLRAAMLRSVEGIQGVDDALMGTDVLGRSGVVIGQLDAASGVRSQYLLDPDDGSLLEARSFMTAYLDPGCPPGTVTGHALFDEDGQPVDPTSTQWVAWPEVVEACAPRVLVAS